MVMVRVRVIMDCDVTLVCVQYILYARHGVEEKQCPRTSTDQHGTNIECVTIRKPSYNLAIHVSGR